MMFRGRLVFVLLPLAFIALWIHQRNGMEFAVDPSAGSHSYSKHCKIEKLGGRDGVYEGYGHWPVCTEKLKKNWKIQTYKVLSVGLGTDISFDQTLIENYKVKVYGIDPTVSEEDIVKMTTKSMQANFFFKPYGFAAVDSVLPFYGSPVQGIQSLSLEKPKGYKDQPVLKAPVFSAKTLLKVLNEDWFEILKLDVEGAEFSWCDGDDAKRGLFIPAEQLLIEFHSRFYDNGEARQQRCIKNIENSGFTEVYHANNLEEYVFVRVR